MAPHFPRAEVPILAAYRWLEVADMRYFVVQTLQEMVDQGPGEEELETTDVRLVPCKDSREVYKAIVDARDADGGDWRLFEMVGDKALSRAIVFKQDDVEIS